MFLDAQGVVGQAQDDFLAAVDRVGVDFSIGDVGGEIPQRRLVENRQGWGDQVGVVRIAVLLLPGEVIVLGGT